MDLIKVLNLRVSPIRFSPVVATSNFCLPPHSPRIFSDRFWTNSFHHISRNTPVLRANKGKSESEPVLQPTLVEEISMDDGENALDDFVYGRATFYTESLLCLWLKISFAMNPKVRIFFFNCTKIIPKHSNRSLVAICGNQNEAIKKFLINSTGIFLPQTPLFLTEIIDCIEESEDDVDDGDDYCDEEEYGDDDAELSVGDGGGGGGISLAGTWWDKKALAIAEEVTRSFDGELQIYAFKTLVNSAIQVRIEKLSNKSGSPSMEDVEAFSTTYRAKLDEAEVAKLVPEDISLEVSSPGVERIVRIPNDLDRFRERPMYVKYVSNEDSRDRSAESEGVFSLIDFDLETRWCTWGLADVRVNREKAGKGRALNKKQREWRISTPFDSLRLVRLHPEM